MLCYVWQVEIFRYKDFYISDHQSLTIPSELLFFCFYKHQHFFLPLWSIQNQTCLPQLSFFEISSACLQFLWSSVLKYVRFAVVNRDKGGFWNQMGFCKWKCLADLEVDFLQALLISDFMGLGSSVSLQLCL